MRSAKRALAWCLLAVLLLDGTGCSRRYFRERADNQVDSLLKEKSCDPRWNLEGYHVYPNPAARFGDGTNPDRPPMPPDDPAAYELSPNPQKPYCKGGCGLVEGVGYLDLLDRWDMENRAEREAREKARLEEQTKDDKPKDEKPKDEPAKAAQVVPAGGRVKVVQVGQPKQVPPAEPSKLGVIRVSYQSTSKEEKPATEAKPAAPPAAATQNPGELTPEQILERAEGRARRELADVVTVGGTIPEAEADKRVSQERTFLIKLEQAVELGLINSREYQTRREDLYQAALPVTVERFAFCPQLFSAETAFNERFGRRTAEGLTNRWRLESVNGFSQLFSTGGLLLLSFANRTVFNLTNAPDTSVSTFSLDIIQPLLRGGGWAVTLEPLTQAERNLLYAVRDFAKFRQDFYVFVAGGQPNIQGVNIVTGANILRGTVSAAPLLVPDGVPVTGSIVGSLVQPQVVPNSSAILGPLNIGNVQTQGYLSTLIEKAQLVNQYRNIVALQRFLTLFRVYLEGGIVNSVQVGNIEQTLLQSIDRTLTQQATYRQSVDQFKQQLGLPMWLRLEVEDGPLQPMFEQTRRYEDISNQYDQLWNEALGFGKVGEEAQLRGRLRKLLTSSPFVRRTAFRDAMGGRLEGWAKVPPGTDKNNPLDARLDRLVKQRKALRDRREQLKDKDQGGLSPKETEQLEDLDFEIELGRYERSLRLYEMKVWEAEKDAGRRLARQNELFGFVYRNFLALLEEAFRERQDRVRKLWPELQPLCVDGVDLLNADDDTVITAVSRAALTNRLDLMNQRAQLVDSWRKIRVAANGLLGTFNVQYHTDASSPLGVFRPFQLGGSRNRHQVILDTQLPLVRIQERNVYRSTLIAYQQQRRALQQAEDQVLFESRSTLRQLRASANSYQTVQKRQVELAYIQVDQALQAFSQPQTPSGPPPAQGSVGPPAAGGGGGDPAALTQQLLQTQNSLLTAQNGLYNTWISYLINRMSLYRDLGLMQLDPSGVWIDDVATCQCPQPSVPPLERTPADDRDQQRPPDKLPAPTPEPAAKK